MKKEMRVKLAILGHFGGKEIFTDGQTVKTLVFERALNEYYGEQFEVLRIDTYLCKRNPIKFCMKFLLNIAKCKQIIVLLSKNGRRVFFPILYISSKLFKKKIYHNAIGGQLGVEASQSYLVRTFIKSFSVNWVESRQIKLALHNLGVMNAVFMPNLRKAPENIGETTGEIHPPFKFCTFSRVMKEKGIVEAVDAIRRLNSEAGTMLSSLHIYGPIEESFRQEFNELMRGTDGAITYCGIVSPDRSTDIIRQYFMLLFPTRWIGEGIPGTISDALFAGTPIIASRWKYCDEMLEHGKTGYCYSNDDPENLYRWIKEAVSIPEKVNAMRKTCIEFSKPYSVKENMEIIVNQLRQDSLEKKSKEYSK